MLETDLRHYQCTGTERHLNPYVSLFTFAYPNKSARDDTSGPNRQFSKVTGVIIAKEKS